MTAVAEAVTPPEPINVNEPLPDWAKVWIYHNGTKLNRALLNELAGERIANRELNEDLARAHARIRQLEEAWRENR